MAYERNKLVKNYPFPGLWMVDIFVVYSIVISQLFADTHMCARITSCADLQNIIAFDFTPHGIAKTSLNSYNNIAENDNCKNNHINFNRWFASPFQQASSHNMWNIQLNCWHNVQLQCAYVSYDHLTTCCCCSGPYQF